MERRRYQRLAREVAVDITYIDPVSKERTEVERSCSRNISALGLLVTTDKKFEVGDTVAVKFHLPGSPEDMSTGARVIRVEEIIEDQFYDIGLEFTVVDDATLNKVNQFVLKELS